MQWLYNLFTIYYTAELTTKLLQEVDISAMNTAKLMRAIYIQSTLKYIWLFRTDDEPQISSFIHKMFLVGAFEESSYIDLNWLRCLSLSMGKIFFGQFCIRKRKTIQTIYYTEIICTKFFRCSSLIVLTTLRNSTIE